MTESETQSAKGRWQFYGLLLFAALAAVLVGVDVERKKAEVAATGNAAGEERSAALLPPQLDVMALNAPADATCQQVNSGSVEAVSEPLDSDRQARPCAISFNVTLRDPPGFLALHISTHTGDYEKIADMPPELLGGEIFSGETAWRIGVPNGMQEKLEVLALVMVSKNKLEGVSKWLSTQENLQDAIRILRDDGISVLLKRVKIDP